jgi:hypothetical protein
VRLRRGFPSSIRLRGYPGHTILVALVYSSVESAACIEMSMSRPLSAGSLKAFKQPVKASMLTRWDTEDTTDPGAPKLSRPGSASTLSVVSIPTRSMRRPVSASRLFDGVDRYAIQISRRMVSPKLWSTYLTQYSMDPTPSEGGLLAGRSPAPSEAAQREAAQRSRDRLLAKLPELPAKEHQMSDRRVQAIDGVWKREVERAEEIEEHAADVAAFREHEASVARRCAAQRAPVVRAARRTLVCAGDPIPQAPELTDKEATREAVRETMFDCVRREEIATRNKVAGREAELLRSRMAKTREMRDEQRRRVDAKKAQEEAAILHKREVEMRRQEKEAQAARDRADVAEERRRLRVAQEAERQQRAVRVAEVIAARRKLLEEKEKAAKEAAEEAAMARGKMVEARGKAKEQAQQGARRDAQLDYAGRLEKVWKHAETQAARCEREYESLRMTSEARESSFTADLLEKREAAMEAARAKALSARMAWERCLDECGIKIPNEWRLQPLEDDDD